MRIGVNTLFLIPGEVGGSETYLCETLPVMIRLAGPEISWVLFTNRENDQPLRDLTQSAGSVEFCRLNVRASNRTARILREQLQLPRFVRRAQVELLWSPGYTAPLFAPCAQVVTILDMQYRSHPDDLSHPARWATHCLVQAAARRCEGVLAISEFSRREVALHTGRPEDRIGVTPLGADPAFAEPLPPGVLRDAARGVLGEEAPFLLCVANTYPHKNIQTLVQGFSHLNRSLPHHLLLVGCPRRGEALLRPMLQRLGERRRRIHRVERIERQQLIALYQAADAFVFPSIYEGFGLPVLEAMNAGTLVITTRAGAIPEVAGDAALYFNPTDARNLTEVIERALAMSPEERGTLRAAARRRAAGFTWARTAELTLDYLLQHASRA